MLTSLIPPTAPNELALDVRHGLLKTGQKELPSKYFYDPTGSALFDVICQLPEYGLTRSEERLLSQHAKEIVDLLRGPIVVAELGSGTGKKARFILEALCGRQQTSYHPIEISASALALCERELHDINSISIVGFESEYLDGLLEVAARREERQRLLVLFLGSTIGNFDGDASIAFLKRLRSILWEGDALLLGADLEKPVETLLSAYDDALGVTAAFNLNLLARLNRELDADFDLRQFEHLAIYNEQTKSIEMHLRSQTKQQVSIPQVGLQITMASGETIWTETSHKYSRSELLWMADQTGFRCAARWVDQKWAFVDSLWIASRRSHLEAEVRSKKS
jgi:L-histidine N-alpha-methyltransferase